jgi:hypothetical protein
MTHANSIGISARILAQEGMSSDTGLMVDIMQSSQMKKTFTNTPETSKKASEYDRAYHGSTGSRRRNIPMLRITLAAQKPSKIKMRRVRILSGTITQYTSAGAR